MISPMWMLLGLPMVAFVIAVTGLPLMKRIASRYAIVSAPYSETLQTRRVPLLGGVAIIAAIMIPLALSNALPLWIGLPTLALLVVGVIDDAAAMRPLKKFLLQLTRGCRGGRRGSAPGPDALAFAERDIGGIFSAFDDQRV